MRNCKVFGVVVGKVRVARGPKNKELALADTVSDPVESHIHGAGTFLFNGVVDDSIGTSIVCLYWRGRLWMAHGKKG